MIEAWLWNRLKTYSDITDIVGQRVYPVFAPQSAPVPFITFVRSSTERSYTTLKQDGMPRVTFEINVWDTDYSRLKVLADKVRTAIDGYRQDSGGFQIRRAFIEDERDIPDAADWGFEQPTFGVQFVLNVSFTETVPTYT